MQKLYDSLFQLYGPQGWWPLSLSYRGEAYHKGEYSLPQTDLQRLEICIGAILTQNTAWKNVAKALQGLQSARLFGMAEIKNAALESLALVIRPAGYFNQKAGYLKNLVHFLECHSFAELSQLPLRSARKLVLSVKGIGAETADCILLYALGQPSFVIDAYTKRFLVQAGLCHAKAGYVEMSQLLVGSLPVDVNLYQEFHALFVEHGKRYYSKKPYGQNDPLLLQSNRITQL